MMEMHQTPPSIDENPPERCSIALYSEESPEKSPCVLHNNQVEDLIDIKVEVIEGEEESYMRGDQPCRKEDRPVNISPDPALHLEPPEELRRLTERHFMAPIPSMANRRYPQRKCHVCNNVFLNALKYNTLMPAYDISSWAA
ncbi:uncharacterized protein LOC143765018 [Ranitomeya variabilis]|uniref:uncharacterized protein LOC143765018 n=1 Tax=Ranitomeya variabilis TaxID=490064 RepID=UPI0040564C3F